MMRRTSSGSARAIFCRIRWTGESGISSPRLGNDRAFVRGAATGVPGDSAVRAFVLMIIEELYAPENINPAYPGTGSPQVVSRIIRLSVW